MTDRDARSPHVVAPTTSEGQVAYLATAAALADRSLAQFIRHNPGITGLQRDNLAEVGAQLRRALDVTRQHGGTTAPCWCSRHWSPDAPVRV